MSQRRTTGAQTPTGRDDSLPDPRFQPIHTRRIFEEICDQIRAELASGSLRPGDKLPAERELAEQFGVSRLAVREALRSLEVSGIIALQKGVKGGAFIREGSPERLTQSMRDMFYLGRISLRSLTEARVAIMQMVIPFACERATEEDFAAIERNVERTDAALANGHEARLASATEFYRLIAACARNEALQMIVDLVTDIVLEQVIRLNPEPMTDLTKMRRRFLRHFRARDAQSATADVVAHLKRLQRYLAQYKPARESNVFSSKAERTAHRKSHNMHDAYSTEQR